jgi:hypothetical protein
MIKKLELPRKMTKKDRLQLLKTSQKELLNNLIQDPVELKAFVKGWTQGFHRYSLRNYILARQQYPEVSLMAGYGSWKKRGRIVKRGEQAIWIITPGFYKEKGSEEDKIFFKAGAVYDVNQTEGEPVEIGHDRKVQGEISFQEVADKITQIPIILQAEGLSNGFTNGIEINIAPKNNDASMVATLIHEVAHIELKHLGNDDIPYNVGEMEAELTSFMVCAALGVDNGRSRGYISNWLKDSSTEDIRAEEVFKIAEAIVNRIIPEEKPAQSKTMPQPVAITA